MKIDYLKNIAVIHVPEEEPEKEQMDIVSVCLEENDAELEKKGIDIIVLDFKDVERISSTVRGEIDLAYASCNKLGYGLACINLNSTCAREYKRYGSRVVPVYADLDALEKGAEIDYNFE